MNYEAILGAAGTGKSTLLRERSAENPNYAKVTATTGIAAVNLGPGVTTVHSALGIYNEESAREALEMGSLAGKFVKLAQQGYDNLVIDEVSMMSAEMLSIITEAAEQAEERIQRAQMSITACGVILTGDWLQLPPVRGAFAFTSPAWAPYEANLTRLTTVYRQTDPCFLDALNLARAGSGVSAVMALRKAGVEFESERNDYFDGMSLMPTNDMANKLNQSRFDCLDAPHTAFASERWGQESGEWRDIPAQLELKVGARVMILANNPPDFTYVNGDTGTIVSFGEKLDVVTVKIERSNGDIYDMDIPYITRVTVQKDKPAGVAEYAGFLIESRMFRHHSDIKDALEKLEEDAEHSARNYHDVDVELKEEAAKTARRWFAKFFEQYNNYVRDAVARRVPYYSIEKRRWVVGWITYLPIRLAWASTIHKVQGLTLDTVQIDARNRFMGSPGMCYVALSRCRTPGNIRIVASPADFARRIQTAKECLRWV